MWSGQSQTHSEEQEEKQEVEDLEEQEEKEGVMKKKKETLWTAAEISRFFLPLRRIFPSNLHSYLAALAGTTKVFSTRPSGRLPATLSACLSASVQVLHHPPQSSVRALGLTVSGLSSTLHVTWNACLPQLNAIISAPPRCFTGKGV